MHIYNSIEETKNNDNKFNQVKEQILIMQKIFKEERIKEKWLIKNLWNYE